MHGSHHEVARLGRAHPGADRPSVAHLAHEDDVRVLPHEIGQRLFEIRDIDADLALGDDGFVVDKEVLDGVLHGHDMTSPRPRDMVKHRGDGGGLAGAGGADDQDQPLVGLRDRLQHGWQVQALERRYMGADTPGHQADQPTLAKDIDPEPVFLPDLVSEIQGPVFQEEVLLGGAHDLEHQFFHAFRRERLARGILQLALQTQLGGLPDLQMEVIGLGLDRHFEVLVQLRLVVQRLVGIQRLIWCHNPANSQNERTGPCVPVGVPQADDEPTFVRKICSNKPLLLYYKTVRGVVKLDTLRIRLIRHPF